MQCRPGCPGALGSRPAQAEPHRSALKKYRHMHIRYKKRGTEYNDKYTREPLRRRPCHPKQPPKQNSNSQTNATWQGESFSAGSTLALSRFRGFPHSPCAQNYSQVRRFTKYMQVANTIQSPDLGKCRRQGLATLLYTKYLRTSCTKGRPASVLPYARSQ